MTTVKKKKKVKKADWFYCSSPKENENEEKKNKAIFKEAYLKFCQSREPNYYMSFF